MENRKQLAQSPEFPIPGFSEMLLDHPEVFNLVSAVDLCPGDDDLPLLRGKIPSKRNHLRLPWVNFGSSTLAKCACATLASTSACLDIACVVGINGVKHTVVFRPWNVTDVDGE
ncbi:hypothetical protein Trydic_g20068 [Trypoxylus dichotomus]